MYMQRVVEGSYWLDERGTWNTWIAGRLKDGVTSQQATANLNTIAEQILHATIQKLTQI